MIVPGIQVGDLFLSIFKYGIYALMVIYILFALIVVRQVHLMTSTLSLGFELPVKLVAYIHLAVSVLALFVIWGLL